MAAVEAFDRLELEILVPLVAVEYDARHHPFEFSNVTLVRLLESKNAKLPILVTLSPIVTLVRLLHPLNAKPPILVTQSGIVTLVRLLHP